MKRSLILLAVLLQMLLLCTCGKEADIRGKLALPVRMTLCEKESGAVFNALIGSDRSEFDFLSPSGIKGVSLVITGTSAKAGCGESTRTLPGTAFPAQELLARAVNAVSGAKGAAGSGEGFYKYSIDETEILVYYDTESGSITSLTAKERGTRYDFTVVNAAEYEEQSYGDSRS